MKNPKNIKILSKEEVDYLREKYLFELVVAESGEYVAVKTTSFSRKVLHDASSNFSINTPIKRITITPEAVKYWKELLNYDLITIQNAINTLLIMYQPITKEEIVKQIKSKSTEIIEK